MNPEGSPGGMALKITDWFSQNTVANFPIFTMHGKIQLSGFRT